MLAWTSVFRFVKSDSMFFTSFECSIELFSSQSASAAHASLSARISQMEKTHAGTFVHLSSLTYLSVESDCSSLSLSTERSAQAHAVFKRDLAAWQATADDARAAQRRAESAAQDLVALSARAEQTTRSEVYTQASPHCSLLID
jgi:hypothetical protein